MQKHKQSAFAPSTEKASRDEMHKTILRAWEDGLFSQVEAAEALTVDQGQLSKIIGGKFRRPSGHAARLFAYAKIRLERDVAASSEAVEDVPALRRMLISKLLAGWDQTTTGAYALASLLDAAKRIQDARSDRDYNGPSRAVDSQSANRQLSLANSRRQEKSKT